MKLTPIVAALGFVATLAAAPVLAADSLVKFDGAIGSQPLRSGPAANIVLGVNPGGIPWVIRTFKADIKNDGRISARGEGLLLGGGDTVGARGGTRFVIASLFCRATPVPPATTGAAIGPFNSEAVDLDADGDFQIKSPLMDATGASPPVPCGDELDNRPVLLIRSANAAGVPGNWFAAGIVKD